MAGIRDEVAPWWGENSAQAYNDAAQKLSKAFTNFRQGRAGFPWFVSFMVVVQRPDPVPARAPADGGKVIGLDLGLTTLITGASPHGEVLLEAGNSRNYRSAERRLAKAQRVASRRQGPRRGVAPSNRWRRANKRVQGIHANVAN